MQHGTNSYNCLIGQGKAQDSMSDDRHLHCRLSLPLNRNIFLLDEMPSHSSQILFVMVIRRVGCLCYKNVFVIRCRDSTDNWLA